MSTNFNFNDVANALNAAANLLNGFNSLFNSMDNLIEKNDKLFSIINYAENEANKIKKKQRRHQPNCKNSKAIGNNTNATEQQS